MNLYLITIVFATSLTIQIPVGKCGPARSLALAAQRSPLKHNETAVAREYGNREYSSGLNIANDVSLSGSEEEDKERFRRSPAWGQPLVFKLNETSVARGYGKRECSSGLNNKNIANDVSLSGSGEEDKERIRRSPAWGQPLVFKLNETSVARGYGKRECSSGLNNKNIANDVSLSGSEEEDKERFRRSPAWGQPLVFKLNETSVARGYGKREVNPIDGVPLEQQTQDY